ncbi:Putative major facilitator, sugar transporter, major facilitator superfamily [Septoria linicola]|uniref:Major facilitator, sugar transporter, major facilitator superfamily n=1 Tax=Septoria linicola TaxID=215465 RepID=A0A9Q9ARM6_9PEZI|nr:putative major facilitator, sugar transporter, major facilitator superfamily [Septoria linicola]USW50781.1 Putative major facilitator, sugar transporter, major facilitator superfamily [Septoria linicola]
MSQDDRHERHQPAVDNMQDAISPVSCQQEETNGFKEQQYCHLLEPKQNATESIHSISDQSANVSNVKAAMHHTGKLQHFPLILRLTIFYVISSIVAWTIICVLVHKPLTTGHYGLYLTDGDINGAKYPSHSTYALNERIFRVARVMQAIIAVSTIPLTSAVCSTAAVTFMQRSRQHGSLSLRKTMVLADKGWADFEIYTQLLRGRARSSLSPLQSIFTTTKTVQTPAHLGQLQKLTDILDRIDGSKSNLVSDVIGPAQLRSSLISTTSTDPQSRLWSANGALNCTGAGSGDVAACAFGQVSLANMSQLNDPFLAQLPAGFSTGLVRQFMPRINSSVFRSRITADEFPADCQDLTNSFHANYSTAVMTGYSNGSEVGISWSLVACMPADQRKSLWNATRARQDFSEKLYLNMTAFDPTPSKLDWNSDQSSGLFKIELRTTTGYFELPNLMNGNIPGPLLNDDPSLHCGRDCVLQGSFRSNAIYDHNNNVKRSDFEDVNGTSTVTDSDFALSTVPNKGPLLTTAMALFGQGSFIADRTAHPEAYVNKDVESSSLSCTERAPFAGLLTAMNETDRYDGTNDMGEFVRCVSNNAWNFGFLQEDIRRYVQMFVGPDYGVAEKGPAYDDRLSNAFEAAAFLANELWLTSEDDATLTVCYDPGAGIQVSHISSPGMILISVLLGIYLVALLATAIYGNWGGHWTSRLDSFTMMQLGAAIADKLPLQLANNTDKIRILDETPGWVGDVQEHPDIDAIGVCVTGSSGFLLLGYDQGVMSGLLTEPNFLEYFPQMEPENKSGAIQALVVAIYEIGCLIGAIGTILFGDKLGRRRSILTGAGIMCIGAVIQTSSFGMAQLIVGRIVTGIGNGMNTSTIPVYQSEIAPPKIRGFLLVLFEGALITLGIMISYWLNYGFWFVTSHGSFQWRLPLGFQIFFAVLLILGILAFPESPRWLLKHNKTEEAAEIMGRLEDAEPDSEQVQRDIKEINEINRMTSGRLTWKEFFSNGREMNGWRAAAACLSQAFQQIGGINLVTYYATTVFEDSLGFDPALSRFMTAWLGTEYFLAACLALFVVDKLGRRNMMMWGAAGMAVSLLVIGASLSTGSMSGAYAATVFIFVYDTSFALGWLGVTWLYPAEVTPMRIRTQANGLSTCSNWIFNYAVVQLAPIMINRIAWKTYFVFFCFNIAFIPCIYFLFPETNSHKLETLDAIFNEAYEKNENPVFTEKRWREKGAQVSVENSAEYGKSDVEVRKGSEEGEIEIDGVEERNEKI